MKTEVKKEVFLIILESLFGDKSKEINNGNCASFCNFLINTLDLELKAIPEEEEADKKLCELILDLICNFDNIDVDNSFWEPVILKSCLLKDSELEPEEFQFSLYKFRKIYIFIKDDFLLGLP